MKRLNSDILQVNRNVFAIGFVVITLLVFSIPDISAQQGPPDDKGPPVEDRGPPEHAGPPEDAGPPDDKGPPVEDRGPPEHAGPPEDAGPPDDKGPPVEDRGPPESAGPPEHAGPPEDVGKPDNTGKPEGVPGKGFGGIVDVEDIVGIEELSTLNVSVPKTATVNNGIRAEGTFLTEIMSANVCGDSLCDRPMSIEEKLQMYLQSRGLTVPER